MLKFLGLMADPKVVGIAGAAEKMREDVAAAEARAGGLMERVGAAHRLVGGGMVRPPGP